MSCTRVLVVEDNPLNQRLLRDILQAMGYTVLTTDNAVHALALAREDPPALILMDISLPGMDGLTATRQLRDDPTTRHIPICAVTAHAMPRDEEAAHAAGCDAYITKPVDLVQFRRTVLALLARASQQRADADPENRDV